MRENSPAAGGVRVVAQLVQVGLANQPGCPAVFQVARARRAGRSWEHAQVAAGYGGRHHTDDVVHPPQEPGEAPEAVRALVEVGRKHAAQGGLHLSTRHAFGVVAHNLVQLRTHLAYALRTGAFHRGRERLVSQEAVAQGREVLAHCAVRRNADHGLPVAPKFRVGRQKRAGSGEIQCSELQDHPAGTRSDRRSAAEEAK